MKRITLDADDLVRRYLAGESVYGLSLALGVDRSVIARHLRERKIVLRSHSKAGMVRARKMTPAQRKAQAAAAHRAAMGREKTLAEQCLTAQTRQSRGIGISPYERQLTSLLHDRGIDTIPQFAIGPYNCDLGADPVAVEVFGGGWHWHGYHARIVEKRFRYILNAGWTILVIAVSKLYPITSETADYIAAFIQRARRDPSLRRQYRMIRGDLEFMASGRLNDDEISIVPTFTRGRNALGQYARVPR